MDLFATSSTEKRTQIVSKCIKTMLPSFQHSTASSFKAFTKNKPVRKCNNNQHREKHCVS